MTDRGNTKIRLHLRFITSYRKNTLAVFFSFTLTFLLLTTMLVLMHTNHRIANVQDKMAFTPTDCSIKDLSEEQIDLMKKDNEIKHLAVEQGKNYFFERNNQSLFLSKGDDTAITLMAKVITGRLPVAEDEVVAEKWTLLNLGIEPAINQSFVIQDPETGASKKCKLVGILSDIYGNKKYGLIQLYTPLDKQTDDSYTAYLGLKKGVNYNAKMKNLRSELDIESSQIKVCPAREDFRELYWLDVKVISVLLVICMVIFYGIYRIASVSREKQYGILRAVGMGRRQLQKMILLELYEIYLVSVPVGIGAGLLLSSFIITISGDRDKEIYLYNEKVQFVPVIPFLQIFICVILVALFIGVIGYMAGRKASQCPVAEVISDSLSGGKDGKSIFEIGSSGGKFRTLFHMGCKYIFRDVKTSSFVILTICMGVTLFTGLAYWAQIVKTYRDDTKEMWYLNGQYAMTMQYYDRVNEGIPRKSAEDIRNIEGVTSIKTLSGMPIRVIDEDNIKRNETYYDELNERVKELYDYEHAGKDNKDQVYKSILCGYNEDALNALKKYVISGDYNPSEIKSDEIILSVLRTDDTKENKTPGSFKEGTPLMQYEAGDEIQIKYRADFKTDTISYERFADSEADYIYKTYKIAAIVSFPYMRDCRNTLYPLLITSDNHIQKIAPESCFQSMYVDGKSGMSLPQQIKLEQRLIRVTSQSSNISTRSLITEIEQNEMFYHKQMVYVIGVALVAFVLVMINMVNNLRYRMQTRTREICMLRAVGMSVAMTRRMLLFENTVLGAVAVMAALILSQPTLYYLYKISDMKAFGHSFKFDYISFIIISAAAMLLCILLSFGILKSWKTKQIMEGIEKVE